MDSTRKDQECGSWGTKSFYERQPFTQFASTFEQRNARVLNDAVFGHTDSQIWASVLANKNS